MRVKHGTSGEAGKGRTGMVRRRYKDIDSCRGKAGRAWWGAGTKTWIHEGDPTPERYCGDHIDDVDGSFPAPCILSVGLGIWNSSGVLYASDHFSLRI